MSESNDRYNNAKKIAEESGTLLKNEFGSDLDWNSSPSTNLSFVVKKDKNYEIILEYNAADDLFLLYDKNARAQKDETLGTFSPTDATPSDIVKAVKNHAV